MAPNHRINGYRRQQQHQSKYRTPNQITNNLFIGSAEDAKGVHNLKSLGIGAVLSICDPKYHTRYPSDFKTLRIDAEDHDGQNISKYFKRCCDFIDSNRSTCGVLVHCYAGISRSATVVIAYLMKRHNIPPRAALNWVRENRPSCDPNNGFRKQLDRWCDYLENRKNAIPKDTNNDRYKNYNGVPHHNDKPPVDNNQYKHNFKKQFKPDIALNGKYRGTADERKRAIMKMLDKKYKHKVPQYKPPAVKDDIAAKRQAKGKITDKRRHGSDPGKRMKHRSKRD